MNKYKFIFQLLSLFSCLSLITNAQLSYNKRPEFLNANKIWAFADYAGLDFNSGVAVPIQTNLVGGAGEGQATVCDPNTGQLLFYTNGATCWNRNGQVMPNGTGLLGNGSSGRIGGKPRITTRQGVVIVPVVGDSNRYYLFSLNQGGSICPIGKASLFYNIVDMTLDNGLGDIMSNKKNIPLDTTLLAESMIAIPGNCNDVWLIVHDLSYSDDTLYFPCYKAYHIQQSGVEVIPVISSGKLYAWGLNSLTVSPDRNYISLTDIKVNSADTLEISKFNPFNGSITNSINIVTGIGVGSFGGSMTTAFSPNSNYLYSVHSISSPNKQEFVQYDISTFDSMIISNSKVVLSDAASPALKLYGDTIYCFEGGMLVGRISNPNLKGLACDYQPASITLLPGTRTLANIAPTEVVYPLGFDTHKRLLMDTFICSGWDAGIKLIPEKVFNGYTYNWNIGATNSIIDVFNEGTYWVSYSDGCSFHIDTFKLKGADLEPIAVTIKVHELGTAVAYDTYQWLLNGTQIAGAIQRTYTVTKNGDYQVIVSNKEGCTDTSAIYKISNVAIREHQLAQQIDFYPNPVKDVLLIRSPMKVSTELTSLDGGFILRENAATHISVKGLADGIYLLNFYDVSGNFIKAAKFVKAE